MGCRFRKMEDGIVVWRVEGRKGRRRWLVMDLTFSCVLKDLCLDEVEKTHGLLKVKVASRWSLVSRFTESLSITFLTIPAQFKLMRL